MNNLPGEIGVPHRNCNLETFAKHSTEEYDRISTGRVMPKYMLRGITENEINSLVETQMSENRIRDEGVELAIRQYGLKLFSDSTIDLMTLQEPEPKRVKYKDPHEDVLMAAISSAINSKGLVREQSR